MNAQLSVVLCSLVLAAPRVPAQAGRAMRDVWEEVASTFREGCASNGIVGASLMFVRGPETVGFEPFGFADRDGGRRVDRDTIFHWASITKTLTGIATMQLRDRGRIELEDSIVELVPELRDVHDPFGKLDTITLRHLLSHSAGFRASTWPWGGDQSWHPHEPTRWEQLVAMMPYTELLFEPGSRFAYSNPGIVFVGRAMETITGEGFEVYTEKNLLRPLGMSRTYFDTTPYHLERHRSHSYDVRGDAVVDLGADFDTGITVSNCGLNAPLTDMARYLAFLLGAVDAGSDAAGVLSRESLEEMWRPVVPIRENGTEQMGITFFVQQRDGGRYITHTGSQRGFQSFFYVHPASGTGAIAVFNTSSSRPWMERVRALCMDRLSR